MTPYTKRWLIVVGVIAVSGLVAEMDKARREGEKDTQSAIAEAIRSHSPMIGMTKAQAIQACGTPEKVNTTISGSGTREQWAYDFYGSRSYLYFDGDLLTTIQK